MYVSAQVPKAQHIGEFDSERFVVLKGQFSPNFPVQAEGKVCNRCLLSGRHGTASILCPTKTRVTSKQSLSDCESFHGLVRPERQVSGPNLHFYRPAEREKKKRVCAVVRLGLKARFYDKVSFSRLALDTDEMRALHRDIS